jgi:hypothetical protein
LRSVRRWRKKEKTRVLRPNRHKADSMTKRVPTAGGAGANAPRCRWRAIGIAPEAATLGRGAPPAGRPAALDTKTLASCRPGGGWRRLHDVPSSELSVESAAARRVVRLLHRMPPAVLDRIRELVGDAQCNRGREHEISAVFTWRREWGDFVPHLGPGEVAWVEVDLEDAPRSNLI